MLDIYYIESQSQKPLKSSNELWISTTRLMVTTIFKCFVTINNHNQHHGQKVNVNI